MKQKLVMLAAVLTLALSAAPEVSAQWVQTNGPYGGHVTALAASGSFVYAGTANSGVFRSIDSGKNWSPMSIGLTSSQITTFAVSGSTIFVSTESGLFSTNNNDSSWIALNSDTNMPMFGALSLKVIGPIILAGEGGGMERSTDSGTTWTEPTGLEPGPAVTGFAVIGTYVFVSTEAGVFFSTDTGASWKMTPGNHGLTSTYLLSIVQLGSNLFAGDSFDGINLSTDSGKSWVPTSNGMPSNTYVVAFAVCGTNVFASTRDSGVFYSPDTGKNWMPVNAGIQNSSVYAFAVSGTNIWAGANDGSGVFISTDSGTSWISKSNGLSTSSVNCLSANGLELIAGTANNGIFLTSDNGTTWVWASKGIDNNVVLSLDVLSLLVSDTNLYAGTNYSSLFRSTNKGTNWNPVLEGIHDSYSVNALAEIDTVLFAGGEPGGVLRSTDEGKSWNGIDTGLTFAYISSLAVSGKNIFAGTPGNGIFLSTDNGANWTTDSIPFYIYALAVKGDDLFAGTYQDIILSTDSGITWTEAGDGMIGGVGALSIVGSKLFAGTFDSGVFLTTNNGITWADVNTGLPLGIEITSFAVIDTILYAGSTNYGVWRRPLSEMVGPKAAVRVPTSEEHFFTAFPNPLTQSTTINFTSPESGAAEITIVNLLGAEVARIYSGELDAGEHSFVWDASAMSPGTYWCEIRMNGRSDQIPIVVQR